MFTVFLRRRIHRPPVAVWRAEENRPILGEITDNRIGASDLGNDVPIRLRESDQPGVAVGVVANYLSTAMQRRESFRVLLGVSPNHKKSGPDSFVEKIFAKLNGSRPRTLARSLTRTIVVGKR